MPKPETFIATKPIFINGTLHQPGQTVTVYPVNEAAAEEQRVADFSDGLVKPADFDPASIVAAPLAGQYVGAPAAVQAAVSTSIGTVVEDVAIDAGIVIEDDAKPRAAGAKPKTNVLD